MWSDAGGIFEGYILGMRTLAPACGLTLVVQMNFTVSDRTQTTAVYSKSHHWNPMQTVPERFKYVAFAHVSGELQKDLCCEATPVCWEPGAGRWVNGSCLTPLSDDVIPLRLKITMQILLSGPGSGDQGLGYQQIHHLWTYASLPAPPAKSSPPLLPGPG